MHMLIALIAPLFSATFNPVSGGELSWMKYTESTPLVLEVNGTATRTVALASAESQAPLPVRKRPCSLPPGDPIMHTLIAFMAPFFSAILYPIAGGELAITQETSTSLVTLEINASSVCTAVLTEPEAASVAEVIIAVVDDDHPGKSVVLANGGAVEIRNLGAGNVRVMTRDLAICRVALTASAEEPEAAIDMFTQAAL
jgi:hypothetical protein